MNSISVNYNSIWELDFAPNYQFTEKGECFNILTGRKIRKVVKGYSTGFNINGKFYTLTRLRQSLVKIKEIDCPF